jgi:hypothetical protein
MGRGRWSSVQQRKFRLVQVGQDRLAADQAEWWLHHVVEAVEVDLAAMLAYDKITIAEQERGDVAALVPVDENGSRPGFLTLTVRSEARWTVDVGCLGPSFKVALASLRRPTNLGGSGSTATRR